MPPRVRKFLEILGALAATGALIGAGAEAQRIRGLADSAVQRSEMAARDTVMLEVKRNTERIICHLEPKSIRCSP